MSDLYIGDKVELSTEGLKAFPDKKRKTGVIVGFGRKPNIIRIKYTGKEYEQSYHSIFWSKLN